MSRDSPAGTDAPSRSNYGERVIRRSFRIGLVVGLLGGLALALVKTFGGRLSPRDQLAPAPVDPWPPLRVDLTEPVAPPATPPAAQTAAPIPDPPVMAPTVEEPPPEPAAEIAPPAPASVAKPAKPAPAAKTTKAAKTTSPSPATKAAKATTTTKTAAPRKKALTALWVTPTGDACPTSHPVKAKLASKIFHVPGMLNYGRTKPDRCYLDSSSAEADGLRAAKR